MSPFRLLCLNIVLKVMDLATTFAVVEKTGSEAEANPIMKCLLSCLGNWAYVENFLVFLLACVVLCRKRSTSALVMVSIIMLLAVANNVLVYLRMAGLIQWTIFSR
jgi:Domain of unknown function (DUF5658)